MQNEASLRAEPEVREALDASGRDAVAEVVAEHPGSPLAWTELADIADSEGRPVDAYAYASVAAELARSILAEAGWSQGSPVPWSDEANRAYLRALDTQRRAADRLGLADRASAAADELHAADAEARARIASEFTPTQVIPIIPAGAVYQAPDDVEAALAEIAEGEADARAAGDAAFAPPAEAFEAAVEGEAEEASEAAVPAADPVDEAVSEADAVPEADATSEAGAVSEADAVSGAEEGAPEAGDATGDDEPGETRPDEADDASGAEETFDFGLAVTRSTFTAPPAEQAADYLANLGLPVDGSDADDSTEPSEGTIEADPESAEER